MWRELLLPMARQGCRCLRLWAPCPCVNCLRSIFCGNVGGDGRVPCRSCKWSLENDSWQPCSRRTCLRPGRSTTKLPGSLAHTLFSVSTHSRAHSMAPRHRTAARRRYLKLHKSRDRTQPSSQAPEPGQAGGWAARLCNMAVQGATIGVSSSIKQYKR